MSRVVFMMLDGVGVGELPDAAAYGDVGSNTLGNVARLVDLRLPNLASLGLGNIIPLRGVPPVASPAALVARLAPRSAGKDTTVGHWEHMGLVTPRPFPTYPEGFPSDVLDPFIRAIGRGILGNKPASGTAIIEELGREHLETRRPIVYTSADSVFQIATHVDVVPLEQLYEWCRIARDILTGPHAMARVIARPFGGTPGEFARTKDRRDFSLEPPDSLYLDLLQQSGVPVTALGKISEIYVGRGVSASIKVGSNAENLGLVVDLLRGSSPKARFEDGLLFTNLVDFDMAWGHRNDPDGFARGLESVDSALPAILGALGPDDRLIISADHGVDPTTRSTDHSREYVPLLYYPRPEATPGSVYEGTFADTGATAFRYLTGGRPCLDGRSVEDMTPERGWREYTATFELSSWGVGPSGVPVTSGAGAATAAARELRRRFGAAPEGFIVLGSGLSRPFREAIAGDSVFLGRVDYADIPGWKAGSVPGHPGVLEVLDLRGRRVALLQGRLHGYEGADLRELEMQVRSLADWGAEWVLLTGAAGGLDPSLAPGNVVLVREVLDFQSPADDGAPGRIDGTDRGIVADLEHASVLPDFVRIGVHASVPGPQYETDAENDFLRGLGAVSVGMSLPAELGAAHELGLKTASLMLITNSGAATHEDVLAAGASMGSRLAAAAAAVMAVY